MPILVSANAVAISEKSEYAKKFRLIFKLDQTKIAATIAEKIMNIIVELFMHQIFVITFEVARYINE